MELLEPEGWRELWERAQEERDTQKLLEIIDQMNRLLAEWEKKSGPGRHPRLLIQGDPLKDSSAGAESVRLG